MTFHTEEPIKLCPNSPSYGILLNGFVQPFAAFIVCKVEAITDIDTTKDFFFIGKTDDEISLVCKTDDRRLYGVNLE